MIDREKNALLEKDASADVATDFLTRQEEELSYRLYKRRSAAAAAHAHVT